MPQVIVDPTFRRMNEIFTPDALARLNDLAEVIWARDDPIGEAQFLQAVASADAVVFGEWRHGRLGLDAAPRLRAVLEVAGGHEHPGLDYVECLRRNIHVGSCAPAFADVVAEMALSLALAAVRGVTRADREMRRASEHWLHDGNRGNTTLRGATIGFVGCGGISRSLHEYLRPFDVTVLGFDPPIPDEELERREITPTPLSTIFERADVVFVLAAPTPENRGLVSAELMELLAPTQSLIIVSRAHLVDFEALTRLVLADRFKVATDVFPAEPLPADHPIRAAESAVLVPHIAGALPTALTLIGDMVVDDLTRIFADEEPRRMQYLHPWNAEGLVQL